MRIADEVQGERAAYLPPRLPTAKFSFMKSWTRSGFATSNVGRRRCESVSYLVDFVQDRAKRLLIGPAVVKIPGAQYL